MRSKKCDTFTEAVEFACNNKDKGEIRWFRDAYGEYQENTEDAVIHYYSDKVFYGSDMQIIASKAIGRRPPEIVVQRAD